jgi:hypothetical protein
MTSIKYKRRARSKSVNTSPAKVLESELEKLRHDLRGRHGSHRFGKVILALLVGGGEQSSECEGGVFPQATCHPIVTR